MKTNDREGEREKKGVVRGTTVKTSYQYLADRVYFDLICL